MSSKALSVSAALLLVAATAGCSQRKPSIEEAQAALSKRGSTMFRQAEFTCAAGEQEYDFICQARYRSLKDSRDVTVQRVGARLMDYYKGEPVFSLTILPDTGAVPTRSALEAQRKAEHEAAAAKAKARTDAVVRGSRP